MGAYASVRNMLLGTLCNARGFPQLTRTVVCCGVVCQVEHLWAMLYPTTFCVDWGANTIPLIESLTSDARVHMLLAAVGSVLAIGVISLIPAATPAPPPTTETPDKRVQTHENTLTAPRSDVAAVLRFAVVFCAVTFLPCGNVFVYVGATKAERWLYLPSFGVCLMLAAVLYECVQRLPTRPSTLTALRQRTRFGWVCVSALLVAYFCITTRRDFEWSNSLLLWRRAEEVAPRNAQVLKNYGGQLIKEKAYKTAVKVL